MRLLSDENFNGNIVRQEVIKLILDKHQLPLIIVDVNQEEVLKWIN
jgi:hypothetical protein